MNYFRNIIYYVHQNPVEAGFAWNMSEWKYSSYAAMLNGDETPAARDEVMELFDGFENFKAFHDFKSGESSR